MMRFRAKSLYPDPLMAYTVAQKDFLIDISKARDRLGYEPKKTMKEAHIESLDWYRDHVHEYEEDRSEAEAGSPAGRMIALTGLAAALGVVTAWILWGIDTEMKIRFLMGLCSLVCLASGGMHLLSSKEKLGIGNLDIFRMIKEGGVNTIMVGLFYALPVFDVERFLPVLFLSAFSKTLILVNFSVLKWKHRAPWGVFYGATVDFFLAVVTLCFAFQFLGSH